MKEIWLHEIFEMDTFYYQKYDMILIKIIHMNGVSFAEKIKFQATSILFEETLYTESL